MVVSDVSFADDIKKIQQQELALRFASFTEADAWSLGSQMREAAHAQKLPLIIDIRCSGRKLFYAALPGTAPTNESWAQWKINVVQLLHKSSYRVGRELALSGKTWQATHGVPELDFAAHGGCFPIHIEGVGVVGTITVSGIPQRADHGFVVEQLCIYLKKDHASLALGPEQP
jgi:uncharacterized protein (UPF0303 family)